MGQIAEKFVKRDKTPFWPCYQLHYLFFHFFKSFEYRHVLKLVFDDN